MESLIALDKELFLWVNSHHSPYLDAIMRLLSWKYFFLAYVPFFLIASLRRSLKSTGIILLWMLISFGLADSVSSRIFKPSFARLRPCHSADLHDQVRVVDHCGGSFGFVSSHAANHFALCLILFILWRIAGLRYGLCLFIIPIMVAYSRVYMGVHFPGDVIGGALLGMILAGIIGKIGSRWLSI